MTVTGSSTGGAAAGPAWRAGLPGFAAGPALAYRPGQPLRLVHVQFDGDAEQVRALTLDVDPAAPGPPERAALRGAWGRRPPRERLSLASNSVRHCEVPRGRPPRRRSRIRPAGGRPQRSG